MSNEIWRNVVGYEGLYMVSDLGNVRSLDRIDGLGRLWKGELKKQTLDSNGYLTTRLSKDGKSRMRKVHQLVCESFLGHIPNGYKSVINHKNFIRADSRLENLEIVSQRENANQKHLPSTSEYTGVSWNKRRKKWRSYIRINKKGSHFHLGLFEDEEEAAKAYQVILFLHNKGFKFKSAKQCREVLKNDWVKLPFNDTEPFFIIAA